MLAPDPMFGNDPNWLQHQIQT